MRAEVDMRGRRVSRLLLARPVLWYRVSPECQVLLVVVRDPEGVENDDFFFTTDLDALPADVVSRYAGRWSIEDTFRAVKQSLGGQEPQSWKAKGPERAAALSFWIYTAVWLWYIPNCGANPTWPKRPWYDGQDDPVIRRCARIPASRDLAPAGFSQLASWPAERENGRHPHRSSRPGSVSRVSSAKANGRECEKSTPSRRGRRTCHTGSRSMRRRHASPRRRRKPCSCHRWAGSRA